ncbi:hypothetical protein KSP40_PGU004737 [Platanthera guangdongensis]|uniref:Uncharacterized protein n=1 Tax=Platanthera guangdongensis TaxID=2320717 RepID=A0ABR2MLX5_9ASPA
MARPKCLPAELRRLTILILILRFASFCFLLAAAVFMDSNSSRSHDSHSWLHFPPSATCSPPTPSSPSTPSSRSASPSGRYKNPKPSSPNQCSSGLILATIRHTYKERGQGARVQEKRKK